MSHSTKSQDRQNGSKTHLIANLWDQVSLCVINGCCRPTHTTVLHCINLKRHWVILGNVVRFFFLCCCSLSWKTDMGSTWRTEAEQYAIDFWINLTGYKALSELWGAVLLFVAHLVPLAFQDSSGCKCCRFSHSVTFIIIITHKTDAPLEDEDRQQLYLYLCCRRTPQWPFSTWRSAPGRGWLCWGRRSRGTGWHSTSPCCLTLDASTWSGCGALPERCRWTGPHWPTSCVRGQKWPPPRGKAGHMLVGQQGGRFYCFKNLYVQCLTMSPQRNKQVTKIDVWWWWPRSNRFYSFYSTLRKLWLN